MGEPLAHRQEGFLNAANPDRVTGFPCSHAVADAEDEEVGEFVFLSEDIIEGNGLAEFFNELFPHVPEVPFPSVGARDVSSPGDCKRRAEIRCEAASVGSGRSVQGVGCG